MVSEGVTAQSAFESSATEFTHVIYENFTLVPEKIVLLRLQLLEGDYVEGYFNVTNFHYYPDVFNNGNQRLIVWE